MRIRVVAGGISAALLSAALLVPGTAGAVSKPPPDQWSSEAAGGGQTLTNLGESIITVRNAHRLAARWQTANGSSFVAPAVVNGVVYRAVNPANVSNHAAFVASSVRTGARLWRMTLPDSEYYRGQSIASGIAVLPFDAVRKLGGVTAVDLRTHKVLWSRSRPASTIDPENDDGTGGPIAVDSGRVYLLGGNNVICAFNLRTGRLLWHRDPSAAVAGIAAGGGRLYTGGFSDAAGPGLVSYNGATGHRQWSNPDLSTQPVIVGSRVLASTGTGVGAVRAAGCGAATCKLLWSRSLGSDGADIGGATTSTFFAAYEPVGGHSGRLARITTATGRVQWIFDDAQPLGEVPIRAGNVVWALVDVHTVEGWSVTARTKTPLKTITLTSPDNGVVGGLADARGSLLVDIFSGDLTAFRIPGR